MGFEEEVGSVDFLLNMVESSQGLWQRNGTIELTLQKTILAAV